MSFVDGLKSAAGPGAAVIAGVIIALLIEWIPAFQAVSSKHKRLVYTVLCFLIPFIATVIAIVTHTFGSWGDIDTTWWPVVISGLAASGIGQLVHAYAPENKPPTGSGAA